MTTLGQFSGKMGRLASNISGVTPREIVSRGGLIVKQGVQAQLRTAAPRGRLNVGKRGKAIGVRFVVEPERANVFMTGPAQLIERDTRPHRIPRVSTRRGGPKLVVIPGVGPRAHANHPGTKGKHPWEKGVSATLTKAIRAGADAYFDAVRRALR